MKIRCYAIDDQYERLNYCNCCGEEISAGNLCYDCYIEKQAEEKIEENHYKQKIKMLRPSNR